MIKSIIDGICLALSEEFGSDYKIYIENVEQGLKEPCFIVSLLNPTLNLYRDKRYYHTNLFSVQFFPASADAWTECAEVFERMAMCMEVVGEVYRASNFSGEVVDGILTVTTNYNAFSIKDTEKTQVMQTLKVDSEVRQ